MKRIIAMLLLIASALSLCACGSLYDKDYLVIEDYVSEPPAQNESDSVTVSRYPDLKSSILKLVQTGSEEGVIVLDANYNGDPAENLARACWELRSQNALCAYCVDNIAYELSQIVTYYEAKVNVSYAQSRIKVSDIRHLNYAYELNALLRTAMEAGEQYIAVLVESGYYSSEDVSAIVSDIYYTEPIVAAADTSADVSVYSGSGGQKLYDIAINYGTDMEELQNAKLRLSNLDLFADVDIENMTDAQRALTACEYLRENCGVTDMNKSSAYDALLDRFADSKGIALAYVEICRELGLKCRIVEGQFNWTDHCWNIIELDGERYHVDVTACISGESVEAGFLYNDSEMWGLYRWDIASYPVCSGELTYKEILEN